VVQHAVGPSDPDTAYPVPLVSVRVKAGEPRVTGNQSEFIPQAPKPPAFLDDIADSEVKGSRTIEFASNPAFFPSSHTINGKKFDNYQNPQEVLLNTVEEWTITNATPSISHPFHIHINPFQLVEIFNPNDDTVPNPNTAPGQPATLPKYVFTDQGLAPGQCYLNPNDKTTWRPCTPSATPTPRVWYDVFPIPAGIRAPNNGPLIPGYFKMRSRFVDYPGYYVLHCHILAHEDRGMMATVWVTPTKGGAPATVPFAHH
jgi:FtsP/CotA-like multicopper oxidase with cupredoxin domain